MTLIDNHNRPLNYLRISVTDRCNLRCHYCMPENGLKFEKTQDLLSIDELIKITKIFEELGVDKVRITGGEPLVREGILDYIKTISSFDGIKNISITTNGTLINKYVDDLEQTKVRSINVSLDSLNKEGFFKITRRNNFDEVIANIHRLIKSEFELKINCVVMDDSSVKEIIPFVEFTKEHNVAVRFLEEMPFNGSGKSFNGIKWNHVKILNHITNQYPNTVKLPIPAHSTSSNYQVPGYSGSFGIIPSYSRTFCNSCNRLRVSHHGQLRTCLYGGSALNIRDLIRHGRTDKEIKNLILDVVKKRSKDGFEAESKYQVKESMTKIGG